MVMLDTSHSCSIETAMSITPALLPELLNAINQTIDANAEHVTELDQAIGDGDHVTNLQRGLAMVSTQALELSSLDWPAAWQKIAMSVMANVGGASGSLYATLFLSLAKNSAGKNLDRAGFAELFYQAIEAVKQRGKADLGEKTMLDVWIPVAQTLQTTREEPLAQALSTVCQVAEQGVEATRDMLATKGRASFLGERSQGHIDAGAKTAQLMVAAITSVLIKNS